MSMKNSIERAEDAFYFSVTSHMLKNVQNCLEGRVNEDKLADVSHDSQMTGSLWWEKTHSCTTFPKEKEHFRHCEVTKKVIFHTTVRKPACRPLCGQGLCTLNGVNYMNETHCIQIMPLICQTNKTRCSSWGWNSGIHPLRKPGARIERAVAGVRGAEQFPLSNGYLPTLWPSVSMKDHLLHSF